MPPDMRDLAGRRHTHRMVCSEMFYAEAQNVASDIPSTSASKVKSSKPVAILCFFCIASVTYHTWSPCIAQSKTPAEISWKARTEHVHVEENAGMQLKMSIIGDSITSGCCCKEPGAKSYAQLLTSSLPDYNVVTHGGSGRMAMIEDDACRPSHHKDDGGEHRAPSWQTSFNAKAEGVRPSRNRLRSFERLRFPLNSQHRWLTCRSHRPGRGLRDAWQQ